MEQTRRRPSRVVAFGAAVVLTATLGATPARAESMGSEAGMGIAAYFATLPYGMVKLVWAMGGVVGAGLAWAFTGGNSGPAVQILDGAVRGDYVLTPEQLRGQEPIDFIGRSPENQQAVDGLQGGEEPAW